MLNGKFTALSNVVIVLAAIISFTFLSANGESDAGALVLTGALGFAGGGTVAHAAKREDDGGI